MAQIFHPSINIIVRLALVLGIALLVGLGGIGYYAARAPYFTEVGVAKAQPVPFSHQQHVSGLGLDCRYCHTAVEESNSASLPPTATCMGCHTQVSKDAAALEMVRNSAQENKPLAWLRVHNLADHVYFNHAIHVKQGVGCETCHGRVDQMTVVAKTQTLHMEWCLDCHRTPEKYLRPRAAVFSMGWQPPTDQATLGPQLVAEYGIHTDPLTDCSICHR